jgi:hypothetical protein
MPTRLSLEELDARDADSPLIKWDGDKTRERLWYAWNWFSYHANQRLAAFNYFLVIVAVLTTGYLTCVDKLFYMMQTILGIVGVLISLAFLALDFRNEQLVDHSRHALRALERSIEVEIHRLDYNPSEKKLPLLRVLFGLHIAPDKADPHAPPPSNWRERVRIPIQHSVWLKIIERAAMILFLLATIHGAYLMCATGSLYGSPTQQSLAQTNSAKP